MFSRRSINAKYKMHCGLCVLLLTICIAQSSPLEKNPNDGLVGTSTSRIEKKSVSSSKDEAGNSNKNTLSDQVAMGKYGLIQKEIFSAPSPRPGILSYTSNEEVPKDMQTNLGGLEVDDIWLAEDHLLVVRGGAFDKKQLPGTAWPPIDNYEAPLRQVKIPAQPAVPPPFPVQLKPGGPIEFIGHNGSRVVAMQPFGAAPPGTGPLTPLFGSQKPLAGVGFIPGQIPYYLTPYPRNLTAGQTPFPIPPFSIPPSGPYPTLNGNNSQENNITDSYDEDDPSVYYPPPYSFYYPIDNSKIESAGPLVPGIILPPPPDFFAPLEENAVTQNNTVMQSSTEPPSTKSPLDSDVPKMYLPIPLPTPFVDSNKSQKAPPFYNNNVHITTVSKPHDFYYYNQQNPKNVQINSPGAKKLKTTLRPTQQIGKLKPIYNYYEVNTVTPIEKPFKIYGPPVPHNSHVIGTDFGRTYVSSTAVPLRSFYEVDGPREAPKERPVPHIYKSLNKPSASFYFYEEPSHEQRVPNEYYNEPYFNNAPDDQQYVYNSYGLNQFPTRQHDQQYLYNNNPSDNSRPVYYRISKPVHRPYNSQTYSRPTFRQQIEEIQKTLRYYTTQNPRYIYRTIDEEAARHNQILPEKPLPTSRPVYQYSFNAVGYDNEQKSYKSSRVPIHNTKDFRPMMPYNDYSLNPIVSDIQNSKKPKYDQYLQVTSETPLETKYVGERQRFEGVTPSTVFKPQYSVRKPPVNRNSFSTTSRPRYHTPNPNSNYYTHQDDGLFDEITKKYFTIFGQKLYNKKIPNDIGITESLKAGTVTTPIPPNTWVPSFSDQETKETYLEHKQKNTLSNSSTTNFIRNQQQFYNPLQNQAAHAVPGDSYVNIVQPRPGYSERDFVSEQNTRKNPNYNLHRQAEVKQLINMSQRDQLPKSLARDELVNYRNPKPPINPDSEYITPGVPNRQAGIVSYNLPGDSAHVYFLTPERRSSYFPDSQMKTSEPNK